MGRDTWVSARWCFVSGLDETRRPEDAGTCLPAWLNDMLKGVLRYPLFLQPSTCLRIAGFSESLKDSFRRREMQLGRLIGLSLRFVCTVYLPGCQPSVFWSRASGFCSFTFHHCLSDPKLPPAFQATTPHFLLPFFPPTRPPPTKIWAVFPPPPPPFFAVFPNGANPIPASASQL